MDHHFDHIHIFKTNVGKKQLPHLEKLLDNQQAITRWNVDTEDCDLVLRVESHQLSESDVRNLVLQCGFECEALA